MDAHILPDLLVFLEVAKAGSISGAAVRLHTVQSNVTARIKKLERALSSSLLKRHPRGIKLTTSGEAALAIAQRLDVVLNDLRFTFGHGQAQQRAKLKFGAIESIAASRLPALLSDFSQSYPQVEIALRTGSSLSLLEQLRSGGMDAVFVSRLPKNSGLRGNLVFKDELVVVAPPAFKTLSELTTRHGPPLTILVQRLGCSYTERLLKHLGEKAIVPGRMLEIGTLEGILGLVSAGLGIATMSRAFVERGAKQAEISCLPLPPRIRKLEIYLAIAPRSEATAIVNEFVEFCTRTTARS